MIRLRILGSHDLHGQDGQVVVSVIARPQRLTLLSYLAMTAPGSFVSREKVIRLFWPEAEQDRGRASLRTALHGLRKSLGNGVLTTRGDDGVGIALDALWCDAVEFETALEQGDLQTAWTLYGGTLLEYLPMPEVPELDRWLEDQRSRLHRKAVETVVGLCGLSEQAGNLEEAVRWAREAESLEPLSEVGARRLIRLLDEAGDRERALRSYDDFAARMADELELEPAPETAALVASIRSGATRHGPARDALAEPLSSDDEAAHVAEPRPHGAATSPPHGPPRGARLGRATAAAAAVVVAVFYWGATRDRGTAWEAERVILSDFVDASGEGIGRAVTAALRVDLLEASSLDLVDAPDIDRTLALMRSSGIQELTAAQAREVALRDGIGAVIDGEVSRAGSGYLITATLREAGSGRAIAAFRVTATSAGDVIAAIDELSEDLRVRSGESLRRIRAGRPLEQVTTSSLEALRLYTEATSVLYRGHEGRSPTDLLEEAIALDPAFAMAWRLLGVARAGGSEGRREAQTMAFLHRERLPDFERYVVEGTYYDGVYPDVPRAIEAYRNALRIDPEAPAVLNNLAGLLRTGVNDLEGGEALQRRAIASPGRSILHYSLLMENLSHQGRVNEAADVLQAWQEAFPESAPDQRFSVLFLRGDLTAAARLAEEVARDPNRPPRDRAASHMDLVRVAHWRGRLDEARELARLAEALSAQVGPGFALATQLDAAYEEALVVDGEGARIRLQRALAGAYEELPATDRAHAQAALRAAAIGDADAVDGIVADWRDARPPEERGPTEIAHVGMAVLHAAVLRGDSAGAVEKMRRLLREAGCSQACRPFLQATLHDLLGEHARAAELFERVLRPGYFGWGLNTGDRLHAMMRLGPLYEALGDTARATAAYRRMVEQWAEGDAGGLEAVAGFRARIAALGG